MHPVVDVLLEILKVTLPALVVFLTVYFILKRYTDTQIRMKAMENQKNQSGQTLPLKLQAYERLTVLCDRINIPNLLSRLNSSSMRAMDLQNAMMIAIQQEYEHNVAMQIYVSEKLWEIVELAKNQTVSMVANIEIGPDENASSFSKKVLDAQLQHKMIPTEFAKSAIKKEVQLIL